MPIAKFRSPFVSAICGLALSALMIGSLPAVAIANGDNPGQETGRIRAAVSAATTIYADAVNGSDSTGDGTQGNPYKSLSMAAGNAYDGDTIQLLPGTYSPSTTNESFYIGMAAVTLRGSGSDSTILDGENDWTQDNINSYTRMLNYSNDSGTTASIEDMTIRGAGEAAVDIYRGNLTINNCVFAKNYHDDSGAAILMRYGNGTEKISITNCVFTENNCDESGGAICLYNPGDTEISQNTFLENEAGQGAAIFSEGSGGSAVDIHCNKIQDSTTQYNGAVYLDNTSDSTAVKFYNNLVTGNISAGNSTSALFLSNDVSTSVYNNTFSANAGGNTLYDWGEVKNALVYNNIFWGDAPVDTELVAGDYYYNDIQNMSAAGFDTNMHVDPLFVDAANGDYHLQAGSPCRGAGVSDSTYPAPDTDLDGVGRPTGTGHVSMGAYEFVTIQFDPLPGLSAPINLDEGQVVWQNPFIIKVFPTSNAGIQRVEFYVDDVLIGTVTEPDASGVYSCAWDTAKYHSLVRVVAYDNQGGKVTLTRNTTVALPYTGR